MQTPEHNRGPLHAVSERRLREVMRVTIDGALLARSREVILVSEVGKPKRYYFPRADVDMDQLEYTAVTSESEPAGTAHFYTVHVNGRTFENAAFCFEEARREHADLKGRVVFFADREGIEIENEAQRLS